MGKREIGQKNITRTDVGFNDNTDTGN